MKWEYRIYSHKQPSGMLFRAPSEIPAAEMAADLNALGAEGWEAVGVFPVVLWAGGGTNTLGVLLKRERA